MKDKVSGFGGDFYCALKLFGRLVDCLWRDTGYDYFEMQQSRAFGHTHTGLCGGCARKHNHRSNPSDFVVCGTTLSSSTSYRIVNRNRTKRIQWQCRLFNELQTTQVKQGLTFVWNTDINILFARCVITVTNTVPPPIRVPPYTRLAFV